MADDDPLGGASRHEHARRGEVSRVAEEARKKGTVLQRTQDGYVETPVDEIPLSDATGEGRLKRGAGEKESRQVGAPRETRGEE